LLINTVTTNHLDHRRSLENCCTLKGKLLYEEYAFKKPDAQTDLQAWADLLTCDTRFGVWSRERIQTDILEELIAPDSAILVYHDNQLVACASAQRLSPARDGIGILMWFCILPAHRGRHLGCCLVARTLSLFAREQYGHVMITTDPDRLTAIHIYLSAGAKPLYTSLSSYLFWWKIRRQIQVK
jgi:RimJ/RimL family protein N-acetyltransferase